MRALLPLLLLVAACGGEARLPEHELVGPALGTTFSVKIVNPAEPFEDDELQADIADTIDRIDRRDNTASSISHELL